MKKNIVAIILLVMLQGVAFAAVKNTKDISLDFTLNYQINTTEKKAEHVMKNALHLSGSNWNVAGRLQTSNNDVLLFLVRMASQHNNKFNLQFMVIDADNRHTFVTEPKLTTLAGLPTELVVKGEGRTITLNALVKLNNSHA